MNRFEEISLKPFNTFGIDAQCRLLYKIASTEQLKEILERDESPYFILGGGSNLLISKDQTNTILKNEILGIEKISSEDGEVVLKVGGGENWHEFVLWTLDQDFGGLENLSLIPGTVGASPIQNIGAYGVELDQVFEKLEAIDLESHETRIFHKDDCQFAYRNSIFKNENKGKYFISYVYFRLQTTKHHINISYKPLAERFLNLPNIKEVSEAVIEIRQSKLPDPSSIGNSGSFFKNPIISIKQFTSLKERYSDLPSYPIDNEYIKVPAGWLIEKAGWKGRRLGDAGTYRKQALVIVNHGNASGSEIWDYAQLIIEDVDKKFSIKLEAEVNII